VAPELARLADEQFGVKLKAVLGDLDFETGQSLGIAVLDRSLPPLDRPAHPGLTRAVTEALIQARGAMAEANREHVGTTSNSDVDREDLQVGIGPSALVVRAPALALPRGVTAEEAFSNLTLRESFRSRLRTGLIEAMAAQGLRAGAVFVTSSDAGLVAGALLRP